MCFLRHSLPKASASSFLRFVSLLVVAVGGQLGAAGGLTDAQIQAVQSARDQRTAGFFRGQSGKPLVRGAIKVDWNNRGDFTRHYVQSIVMFAMRSFQLEEQINEANAALREMCQYHLDRPKTLLEIHSFPSGFDGLIRLCMFYGPRGTLAPNRITAETYDILLKTIWEWTKAKSLLSEADVKETMTWWLENSENHHAQHFSNAWGFSKILMEEPAYRNRAYDDGHTAAEHYKAWTIYLREYLRQRACKGMTVEIDSPSYATATLRGIYSFYDFSDDPVLKKNARQFLDLYWALWAEHEVDAVHGGGKTRTYAASAQRGTDFMGRVAWYALGIGDPNFVHSDMLAFATTTWRMPDVVIDLALDVEGRGTYEIRQRRMGLAWPGFSDPHHYRLKTDFGGILRYAFCTPDFIMGSLLFESRPVDDWSAISRQNRWDGVIFRGDADARVFPAAFSRDGSSIQNGFWSAQAGGTMISQKLKRNRNADEWRVWFSKSGLSAPVRDGDWYFAEAAGAFVGVRVARGTAAFSDKEPSKFGQWLVCEDDFSPVIIEVARKSGGLSFNEFKGAVKVLPFKLAESVLTYTSLRGDQFTFSTDESETPRINGKRIDYAPTKVFDSPFVQSVWDSGVVTVQKGERKLTLNFNY